MGWVEYDKVDDKYTLVVRPYKTDMETFKVVKTRGKYNCLICDSLMPSTSRVFGSGWNRLCLKCGGQFLTQAIKDFEKVVEEIKADLTKYNINKDKWNAENMVASL